MDDEKLLENPEEIKINDSHDLIQILGKPPGWILYWGITIIAGVVIGLFLISWFVKYPDIIPAKVVLTTENPPLRVFTRIDGKLNELIVKDNDEVNRGDLLAVVENTADRKDILALESFLLTININSKSLGKLDIPRGLNLGDLQNSFSAFVKRFDEYTFFLDTRTVQKKVYSTKKQIKHLQSLNSSLEKQAETLRQVVVLAEKSLERNKELLKNEVASKVEVEDAETVFLQKKQDLETLSSQLINNNIEIEELKMRILELRQGKTEEGHSQSLGIKEDFEKLKNEIRSWKQQYLIVAPISGKISMPNIWSDQKYLKANEEVLAIVPEEGAGRIIGKAVLPFAGSGKVKKGMPVNIRLDGYPYQEFGSVQAKIKSISLVPENGQYQVELDLPDKLLTTYNKPISFRQEMGGVGNIVTENRRILIRIFDKLWSIVRND